VGAEIRLPLDSKFRFALARHDWKNVTKSSLDGFNKEGNREAGNIRQNEFGVLEFTGELTSALGGVPISLQSTHVNNRRVKDNLNGVPQEKKNNGRHTGVLVGKASQRHTAEIAYFYKYAEADCTIDEVTDSDFGSGGTNRKGHVTWVAYAPITGVTLVAKYMKTKNIDETLPDASGDVNRFQLETYFKF
jgi:hypothetical protein